MLDIYQINPYLIGLLGQETLTDFELKNLSIEIEKTSNNKLKEIKEQISSNQILLFMKGTPYQPQCGFSAKVSQILFEYDVEFSFIDVLEFPDVRANLPSISDWPTFPQLFVKGELIGGCDIITELHEKKQLSDIIN